MGCGISKLDPDEEPPPAALRRPSTRLRLIGHRRNNNNNSSSSSARVRKDSIVSTTELLRLEDSEVGDVSPDRSVKAMAPRPAPLFPLDEGGEGYFSTTKADDDERRRLGSKPRRLPGKDEEELPGSPSFRIYFGGPAAAADEEGSVKDGGGKSSSINYN